MVFVTLFLMNKVIFLNFSRKRLNKQLHVDNGGMKADRQTDDHQTVPSKLAFSVKDTQQRGPAESQES